MNSTFDRGERQESWSHGANMDGWCTGLDWILKEDNSNGCYVLSMHYVGWTVRDLYIYIYIYSAADAVRCLRIVSHYTRHVKYLFAHLLKHAKTTRQTMLFGTVKFLEIRWRGFNLYIMRGSLPRLDEYMSWSRILNTSLFNLFIYFIFINYEIMLEAHTTTITIWIRDLRV